MPPEYLHQHKDFANLLRIVGQDMGIDPALVEKDYWIMHCLNGLQVEGLSFQLKGGTSLSKGYGVIHRFSEDIDIRIDPPEGMDIKSGRNQMKPAQVESRRNFYDWLATHIIIHGMASIERDTAFDDGKYRSGGIRLHYDAAIGHAEGLKQGVLLEVGFDDVTPNIPLTISSWAYDYACDRVAIRDNRAKDVACYHPGYTLVEKLQTISTKYRQQRQSGQFPVNFMRHYYDVYCLLEVDGVPDFIGSEEYRAHKQKRFRSEDNPVIADNPAFFLEDDGVFEQYCHAYEQTKGLYYRERPDFRVILDRIQAFKCSL